MTDKGKRPTWQELDEAETLITEQTLIQSGVLPPKTVLDAATCGNCRWPSMELKPYRRGHIDSTGLCPGCIARADALFDAWERGEPVSKPRADWDDDVFARARRGQGA